MKKTPVICIVGPTAVGKSDVGVALSQRWQGEVISADSMQVYRGMDIGTAKLSLEERQGIVHHMIDVVSPRTTYTVHDYAMAAREAVQACHHRGHLPMIVGGTGLYVRAVIDHFDFTQTQKDTTLRDALTREAEEVGSHRLHERLQGLDREAANRIHPHDVRRIVRALEVVLTTGKTMRANYQQEESPFFPIMIGLTDERNVLYARIERRMDRMIERGLLEEVRTLLAMGCTSEHTAMQAIGYKELTGVLQGEVPLDVAIEQMKQATRRYAKRQLSWFRGDSRIEWYSTPEDGMISENFLTQIEQTIHRKLSDGASDV